MQPIEISFLSDPNDMLKQLRESCQHQTVVGISAPILGNGVFLTAVDDIIQSGDDYLILLKGYDVTGYILERNKIRLSDVRAICPFKSEFRNPYLKELAKEQIFE